MNPVFEFEIAGIHYYTGKMTAQNLGKYQTALAKVMAVADDIKPGVSLEDYGSLPRHVQLGVTGAINQHFSELLWEMLPNALKSQPQQKTKNEFLEELEPKTVMGFFVWASDQGKAVQDFLQPGEPAKAEPAMEPPLPQQP